MKLCHSCLDQIKSRLTDEDYRALVALYRKGPMNRDGLMIQSKLTSARVRDAISRLYGAGLIDTEKQGNSLIVSLTEAGLQLIKGIEKEIR